MMRELLLGTLLFATFGTFAATYYVDADASKASDDYDGMAEVWDGTHGPKHTLAGVMKVAKTSGDVVIALPGVYDKGEMNDKTYGSNRVVVAEGVLLKSRDGAHVTTIEGKISGETTYGCGADSLRCAQLEAGAVLCGFTVTKGRSSPSVAGNNAAGGGVHGGYCVDCVFSNNVSGAYSGVRGHHVSGSTLLRCYLGEVPREKGSSFYLSSALDCVLDTPRTMQNACRLYNTTILRGNSEASETYPSSFYNCVLLGGTEHTWSKFHNCRIVAAPGTSCTDEDGKNEFSVKVSDLQYDPATFRPAANSHALDRGDSAYYALATNGWTKLARSFVAGSDYAGGSRVYNGMIDIGAGERNPCADFSAILSVQGVITVTNVTSSVMGRRSSVFLGAGEALLATLNRNGGDAATRWGFFAEVKGTGALKVFFGEAEIPVEVTAADGKKAMDYTAADTTALRLAYEGEDGGAEVSCFVSRAEVNIAAESAGLDVSGDITDVGPFTIQKGQTVTFTVARSNAASRFVSGIEVNGEFFDFYDYPDGKTFTASGDDIFSSLTITAVYAEPREWFVDDDGDDANCGLYTNMAFKTLAKAASVAKTSGDTITVLPGVYNEGGTASDADNSYGSNRVSVASGVLLRSAFGPAVTMIEGKISEFAANGCWSDSMRAVSLGSGAVLCGFTVTKGRSLNKVKESDTSRTGGGVRGGLCVDCVFTNNATTYRADAASGSTLLRCLLAANPSSVSSYFAYSSVTLIDCVENCGGTAQYRCEAYNTTFLKGRVEGYNGSSNRAQDYNCVFYGSAPKNSDLYNCLSVPKIGSGVVDMDGLCQFGLAKTDLPYDTEMFRPLPGSLAIDRVAATNYYALATNGWSKLWQSFVKGSDYAGGQRVYNGVIDIGCGEYDWRENFAARLAPKDVAVETASAGVTTNSVAGVDLADGETLTAKCTLKTDGRVSFRVAVAGDGAVTVTVGGTELVPVGGVCSFDGVAGENDVTVSFAGDGLATVCDFVLPKPGVLLIVR